jgi:glutathione S-transferase
MTQKRLAAHRSPLIARSVGFRSVGMLALHGQNAGNPMIKVHHLNESRSQRILWLLEELGAPYEIIYYQRDGQTRLAPPELKAIHPLGKSPVMEDGAVKIAESGAIVEYLCAKYADRKLAIFEDSPDWPAYIDWLHYAEGSAMLPLMLGMYTGRLGDAGAPLKPRIDSETHNHISYLDAAIKGRDFFVGDRLTGADIQLSFVPEVMRAFGKLKDYPSLDAWIDRMHARPAWKRALEKGGEYALGR